jgi:N6-L-threonylcarbamoyladenine synthase
MKKYYVGFDTSNYTTSMAACDEDGNIIANVKIPLPVKEGERGLRQSDAVFYHTRNLSEIFPVFKHAINGYDQVVAVGASAKPRDAEDSYMPCFLSGKAVATAYSSATDSNLYLFSHQSGHIMAALYSAFHTNGDDDADRMEKMMAEPFAAFHVSGGTTEILYVKPSEESFAVEKIGGTTDLNAGQAIDRVGVKMGLRFPCGPRLEELALENTQKITKPRISVSGLECCLSGLENLADGIYRSTQDPSLTAAYTIEHVAATLDKLTENLRERYESIPIVYAGGVMSNEIIKRRLSKREGVYFSAPMFSADNAAGIALLCRRKHLNENK